MSGKSFTLCDAGVDIVNKALTAKGWSHETLAKKTVPPDRGGQSQGDPISTKTVQSFIHQKPISVSFFQAICASLELDWEVMAGRKAPEAATQTSVSETANANQSQYHISQTVHKNIGGNVISVVEGNLTINN